MMTMNVIFINDGACDGVFRQFWLTVLLLIKAIKLSHFVGTCICESHFYFG